MTPGWQGLTVEDDVAVPIGAGHQAHPRLVQQLGRHVQGDVWPVPEDRDFNATYRNTLWSYYGAEMFYRFLV